MVERNGKRVDRPGDDSDNQVEGLSEQAQSSDNDGPPDFLR
jgi:hypothetical protein